MTNAIVPVEDTTLLAADEVLTQPPATRARAGYLVMQGGEIYTPNEYRSRLETMWKRSLQGLALPDQDLADAFSISVTAYACTEYCAQTLASIPVKVTDPDGDDVDWHPFDSFLSYIPTILWYVEASRKIWGKAYLRKIRNSFGYPSAVQWLNPLNVQPQINHITDQVESYWLYPDNTPLRPDEIIPILKFDPNDPNGGISPYELVMSRIHTERSMQTFAAEFFFNRARPDGILTSKAGDYDDEQLEKKKNEWKQFRGAGNGFKTFVSDGDWTWQPVTFAPVDLTMGDLTKNMRIDTCIAFRTNPVLIGAGDAADALSAQSTFDGIRRDHLDSNTVPNLNIILSALTTRWAYTDFDEQDYYTFAPDTSGVSLLSQATEERARTVQILTTQTPALTYNEGRKLVGYSEEEDFLKRDPTQVIAAWNNGALTWNKYRAMLGEAALPIIGEVVKIGENLLPVGRLLEIAAANAERLIAMPAVPGPLFGNFGISQPELPKPAFPALPANTPPAADADQPRATGQELCIMLDLSNHPDLLALQTRLKEVYSDQEVRWNDPGEFHVTLLYMPNAEPVQQSQLLNALEEIPLPELALKVGGLRGFDAVGEYALHFRLRRNADLLAFQQQVYDLARGFNIPMSAYSDPAAYTPHITMGYAKSKVKAMTFEGKITVQPQALICSAGKERVYDSRDLLPEDDEPEIVEQNTRNRALKTMSLCVDFAGNQMVRLAQRTLSQALTDRGLSASRWTTEEEWCATLLSIEDANAASEAAVLLRSLSLDEWPKVNVYTDRYQFEHGMGYLTLQPSEALNKFNQALSLEVSAVTGGPVSTMLTIPLCYGLESMPEDIVSDHYPLVLNNVALRVNDKEIYRWKLKNASEEELRELRNWQHKVSVRAKRGESISEVPFEPIALAADSPIVAYVRRSLCCADHYEQVFEVARAALITGDYRAIEEVPEIEPAPKDYQKYWAKFDKLQHDLGVDWLEYMDKVGTAVQGSVSAEAPDISAMLAAHHDELIEAWTGTPEKPGPLTSLILAGMAAGNETLIDNMPANPTRALSLEIDWNLLSQEAWKFARGYSFNLVETLDATTQRKVQKIYADWLKSGASLDELVKQLDQIFNDAERALQIGQTESIVVYNEGAFMRWQNAGVEEAVWVTVNDQHVCALCRSLNGTVALIATGWTHPGGNGAEEYAGKIFRASAHSGCRCFRRPLFT